MTNNKRYVLVEYELTDCCNEQTQKNTDVSMWLRLLGTIDEILLDHLTALSIYPDYKIQIYDSLEELQSEIKKDAVVD